MKVENNIYNMDTNKYMENRYMQLLNSTIYTNSMSTVVNTAQLGRCLVYTTFSHILCGNRKVKSSYRSVSKLIDRLCMYR